MLHLPLLDLTSDLTKYPTCVREHLVTGDGGGFTTNGLGRVCKDGKIAILAKGANMDVLTLPSNERLSAWTFGADLTEPEIEITAVQPFSTDPTSKVSSHVLVGLDLGLQGMVAVFDITECRVVRAIALPQRVTSMTLVSGCGGPHIPAYIHPALLYFHGIVAVGLVEGRVILLDLCLDEGSETNDSQPHGVFYLGSIRDTRDVGRLRRKAVSEGTHLAIELTPFSQGESFVWDQVSFPADNILVTTIDHSHQLASLAIGFNMGGWCVVSLCSLQVDYSSPYSESQPVTHLTWQEPLDDPRHHVYYWVFRGDGNSVSTATLYSLTYQERQWDLLSGPLYSRFECASVRFQHDLGCERGDPVRSQPVAVTTIELPLGDTKTDQSGGSEVEQYSDMGIVVMVWSCDGTTYMGVFDINCWYQAHMPGFVETEVGTGPCSYFSICAIDSLVGNVVDLMVDPASLAKFAMPGSLVEQHFYPSSLKFDLVLLTLDGWLTCSHLGLQRKVLSELSRTSSLVQPSELYQFCLLAGLAGGNSMEPSLLAQRRALLNVALEHSMVGVVVAAARDWADGKFSKAGCSLKFLMDWAWSRVAALKEHIDGQTVSLFDHSVTEIDSGGRSVLVSYAGQLAQLVTVLSSLASMSGTVTSQGLEELECKLNVTGLVLLYTQAISWFVNVGLLPEQPDGGDNPFPVSMLTSQYQVKRQDLGKLSGPFGKPQLLIDILCQDIGDDLVQSFQRAGGSGSYPPPSLHALITVILSEASASSKLRLIQYFFLDLAHINHGLVSGHSTAGDLVDNLIKFPSAFSLPPSIIKLTQAFWLLDHEDWEEAVLMMLDPLLSDDDLNTSHHRAILVSLLAQGQAQLALKYTRIRRPPVSHQEDIQLHLSVLLANGAIQEAFTFQRSRRGGGSSSILQTFYQKAEELNKLDSVLQLSLSTQEEKEFVQFLKGSRRPDSQEVLLMYYLQRARFTEAMQLNERLSHNMTLGSKSTAREAIMARYNHILPGLASSFGNRRINLTSGPGQQSVRPVPLSVSLQNRNINLKSHATLIEQRLAPPLLGGVSVATPFRSRQTRSLVRPTEVTEDGKRKFDSIGGLSFANETLVTGDMSSSMFGGDLINHGSGLVSPPAKRTRLSDVSSLNMSAKSIRRMSRYMTADAITILSTPTIVLKHKSRVSMLARPTNDSIRTSGSSDTTPQSILKVKQLIQAVAPTKEEERMLDVDLPLEDTAKVGQIKEDTSTKSLRFTDSTVGTDKDETIDDRKRLSNVSHGSVDTADSFHSVDSEMDMEVDREEELSVVEEVDSVHRRFNRRKGVDFQNKVILLEPKNSSQEETTEQTDSSSTQEETTEQTDFSEVEEAPKSVLSAETEESIINIVSPQEEITVQTDFSREVEEAPKSVLSAETEESINNIVREAELTLSSRLVDKVSGSVAESEDSDMEQRGVSWQRRLSQTEERVETKEVKADVSEVVEVDEEEEDEEDSFYDDKVFEKKECDITFEPEVVEEESEDDDEAYYNNKSFERKECDIEILEETTGNESVILEDSEEEEEGDVFESKKFNYSWAPLPKKTHSDEMEDVRKIVEETISRRQSVQVVEYVDQSIEEAVEIEDKSQSIMQKSRISTIDLEDTVEETPAKPGKPARERPKFSFNATDDSFEEVIEIEESDDDSDETDETPVKVRKGFTTILDESEIEVSMEKKLVNMEDVGDYNKEENSQNKQQLVMKTTKESVEPIFLFGTMFGSNSSEVGQQEDSQADEVQINIIEEKGQVSSKDYVDNIQSDTNEDNSNEDNAIVYEESQSEDNAVDIINLSLVKHKTPFSVFLDQSLEHEEMSSSEEQDMSPIEEQAITTSEETEIHKTEEQEIHKMEEQDNSSRIEQVIPLFGKQIVPSTLESDMPSLGQQEVSVTMAQEVSVTVAQEEESVTVAQEVFVTVEQEMSSLGQQEMDNIDEHYIQYPIEQEIPSPEHEIPSTGQMQESSVCSVESSQSSNILSGQESSESVHGEEGNSKLVSSHFTEENFFTDKMDEESDICGKDDMREMLELDKCSTTATRASSVSGSIFQDDLISHPPTFTFSEPEHMVKGVDGSKADEIKVNFNFSMPLDSSRLCDFDVNGVTIAVDEQIISKVDEDKMPANQIIEQKDEEYPRIEEVEYSSEEESDEDVTGLEFSWTKIPEGQATGQDVVESEMPIMTSPQVASSTPASKLGKMKTFSSSFALDSPARPTTISFSTPIVEAELNTEDGKDDSHFIFHKPHDESVDFSDMEAEDSPTMEADTQNKFQSISATLPSTSPNPIIFPSPIVEAEKTIDVDKDDSFFHFDKPHDESVDFSKLETDKSPLNDKKSPKKEENKLQYSEMSMTIPSSTPGTPRRSTRKASKSMLDDDPSVKTLREKSKSSPLKVIDAIPRDRKESLHLHLEDSPSKDKESSIVMTGKSRKDKNIIALSELPSEVPKLLTRTISQSSTIPMESDNDEEQAPAPLKKSTRGRKSSVKTVGSDMDTSSFSEKVSSSSVSTVLMESVDSNNRPTKSTVSSGLKDLVLLSPQTSSPGTPVRRSSRRSSSGASPMQSAYDTLELRGRRVTETLSLTENFGQNKDVSTKSPKYDTLELRNRSVTETLSLTKDFGHDSNLEPEKLKIQPRGRTRSQADVSPAPLVEKMSTSPISSAILSTRKRRNSRSSVTGDEILPTTPLKSLMSTPSLMTTPVKGRVMTPLKEALLTPTRRSRRLSGSDHQELPLTPTRRSRRLSGSGVSDTESAPDGGLITGITPRATPGTPRSRRHTSVRAGDVEAALVLAGNISSLPPVLEEEENNQEMEVQQSTSATTQQKLSTDNEIVEEEDDTNTTDTKSLKRWPTSPPSELSQPATKRRASRRVTITTLGSDVNLLTPPEGGSKSSSRASLPTAGKREKKQKKYVAVKKKTSVRIK